MRIALPSGPDGFDVSFKGGRDEAGVLFDLVDEMGLVSDVVVAKGDEFFQSVREKLATNSEPTDGGLHWSAVYQWCDCCMGVA